MAFTIIIDGHNFINDLTRYGKDKKYILNQLSFPALHEIIQSRLKAEGLYSHPFIHSEFICSDKGQIGPFKGNERNKLIEKLKNEKGVTVREVPQHTQKQKGVDSTVFIRMMTFARSPAQPHEIVLFASDTDYVPALKLMSEQGSHVIVVGFKNKTPLLNEALINESYLFLDLESLLDELENREIKKVDCSDETAKQLVKKFGSQIVELRIIHNMFKELFEDEEAHILMERTANSFFSDLNTILQHYILLEFAKITDPARTMGQENFTADNLIESIEWPQDVQKELMSLSDKTKVFRKFIKKPRNKLFAHKDKKVHLSGKVLGSFPKGDDEVFLQTLEEICNTMHKACFNTIFGQISVAAEGDVFDLKKTLKRALAFEKKFSESTGKEKSELFSLVRGDVRKIIQQIKD